MLLSSGPAYREFAFALVTHQSAQRLVHLQNSTASIQPDTSCWTWKHTFDTKVNDSSITVRLAAVHTNARFALIRWCTAASGLDYQRNVSSLIYEICMNAIGWMKCPF